MNRTALLQDRRVEKFCDVLSRWEAKSLTGSEAAEILGMSERTFRRCRRRHEAEGLEGLFDRRLGKASERRAPVDKLAWMLEEYRTRHVGWTVKHFHDHLRQHHDFGWGYTWTKTRLQSAGLVAKAPKRGVHRRRRPRKPCVGMMLHQDGSRHEWLAGEAPLDLIVTLDDATSEIYHAVLVEEEGTVSTFQALLAVFTAKGLPSSLYTDRGSHYFLTPEAGGRVAKDQRTQVGRALHQLGIEHIAAYSPEARGRSERAFGTLQDRLVKELSLAGSRDVAEANRYIAETYLPDHNRRFAKPPELAETAFVSADASQIREALCLHSERVVARDNTVRYGNRILQIPASPVRPHYVKAKVRVHEYPDGDLAIFHGPKCIARYDADGALVEPAQPADCVNRFDAADQPPVDKWTARRRRPDHFPTGTTTTTEAVN